MPRPPRRCPAGTVFHVLNRANARATIFAKEPDYQAFLRILAEALDRTPLDLFAYCVMPNHWHLLLRPRKDNDLSRFMRWLTLTHAQRHHAHYHALGLGHLYQGRFKSFPVQDDEHFLTCSRYILRNPLRARLVRRAELWPWSSLAPAIPGQSPALAPWPVPPPRNWLSIINQPQSPDEEAAVQRSIQKGTPFGSDDYIRHTARRLRLSSTLRDRGRPPNSPPE